MYLWTGSNLRFVHFLGRPDLQYPPILGSDMGLPFRCQPRSEPDGSSAHSLETGPDLYQVILVSVKASFRQEFNKKGENLKKDEFSWNLIFFSTYHTSYILNMDFTASTLLGCI